MKQQTDWFYYVRLTEIANETLCNKIFRMYHSLVMKRIGYISSHEYNYRSSYALLLSLASQQNNSFYVPHFKHT
jgi:hypothetical protein